MYSGVRLSQLAVGEPLLNVNWEYKELKGKAAVEKRFEDVIYNASYLGFTYLIDTVRPQVDESGNLTLKNNGVGGDIWTFEDRMTIYKNMCASTGMKLVLEFDFPTTVTLDNVELYKKFFLKELVAKYEWVKFWQIGVEPERKDVSGAYSCAPDAYVDLMKYIYVRVKNFNSSIHVGGPGCFEAINDYVKNHDGWLAAAFGEYFDKAGEYTSIGAKGFLPYIDFFAFQGKQNTTEVSYANYENIITVLKEGIYTRLGDNSIYFISTKQGWKADTNDEQALKQQGYYDIREMLNSIKHNVVPFKNELVDAYPDPIAYNGRFDSSRLHYGMLTWYLGQKDEYADYAFILQQLKDYSEVYNKPTKVFEENSDIDSITFRRVKDGSVFKATVIWSKSFGTASVVLLPANYQREYQTENGSRKVLSETTQVQLKNTHFLIVFETINQLEVDTDYLTRMITRKLQYHRATQENLISLLPSSYNKETTDTNFYKLLRAVSVEMSDAKITLDMMKDDLSLDLARDEALYNNFGVLVKLRKKAGWTDDKYRRLIKGVTKSLLDGPTYQSVVDALQLFTNFHVSISELYKDADNYDDSILQGINTQYAFIVEIEKPLDDTTATQDELKSDTNFILNIVKPAHTLSILIITLSGSENWPQEYADKHGYAWKDMDSQDGSFGFMMNNITNEATYGWRGNEYDGVFKTSIASNTSLTNGGNLIGPRYVLYDKMAVESDLHGKEDFDTINEIHDTIFALLDFNLKEKMKTPESAITETAVTASELTFGFEDDDFIQLTGGLDKRRILNKFKLAPKSKLKDDNSEFIELFLREQYVFSNTLKTIRFSNTFGFNSKFYNDTDRPYAIAQYLYEHTFKEIERRLADGTVIYEDRLKEELEEFEEELFEDYDTQAIKEKITSELKARYTDKFYDKDDPYTCFTLNITPVNRHKLGPNLRALYSASLLLKDHYDKARDFLENILKIGFSATYDKAKEKRVDYGEVVYDESDVLKDEKEYGIRLNTIFLNNTRRKFIHRNIEHSEYGTRLYDKAPKPVDSLDNTINTISSEVLEKIATDHDDANHIIRDTFVDKKNAIKMEDAFATVTGDKYNFDIREERALLIKNFNSAEYVPKEDKLLSMFMPHEYEDEFIIYHNDSNFFKLNHAQLNMSFLSWYHADSDRDINSTSFDKYLFPIKTNHVMHSEWLIDYHYHVKEDKLLTDYTMGELIDDYIHNEKDHGQIDVISSDKFKEVKEELLPKKMEVYLHCEYVAEYDKFGTNYTAPEYVEDYDTQAIGNHKDINSIVFDKYTKTPEEWFSFKNAIFNKEEYHDVIENHHYAIDTKQDVTEYIKKHYKEHNDYGMLYNDVYMFRIKEIPSIEMVCSEKYDKEHIELTKISTRHEEHRNLQPTIYNAFKFTTGRFNLNRFLRINLIEDNRWNSINNDQYKFSIKEYHEYQEDCVEPPYKPKDTKHIIYARHSNNDTYSYTINENQTFFGELNKTEYYELKSVVGYMQLDRYKNGKKTTIKKGTLV